MYSFVLFVTIVGCVLSSPIDELDFIEDTAGNYNLRFNTQEVSRTEQRFVDGKVVGSYSYVDTDGVHHTVTYVAAPDAGFTASSDDIPISVPETPEILHARAAHYEALAKEQALNPHGFVEEKPVPVHNVLARLVVPSIATLPRIAVPDEDADLVEAKHALLEAYAKDLERLAVEYKRTSNF